MTHAELLKAKLDLSALEREWQRSAPSLPLNAVLAVASLCNAIAAVRYRVQRLSERLHSEPGE